MITDGASDTPGQPATGQADLKIPSQPKGGRAKKKHGDSSAVYLWHRLDALDFMNQAMLLAGTLLLCVVPLFIVLAALSGKGVASALSRRLGLNQQAAADMGHLFTSSGTTSATLNVTSLIFLVLFAIAGGTAVQQLYERIFDLESRGARDLLRRAIWTALVVGWAYLSGLAGPSVRAGGPILVAFVVLVAFTLFWWFSMRFLLSGRVTWRRLFPCAVVTGLCWLGMVGVFSATISGMVISSYDRYGPIGIVFDLLSYALAIGVVIILGAVTGLVWQERNLSFRAAFRKVRRVP